MMYSKLIYLMALGTAAWFFTKLSDNIWKVLMAALCLFFILQFFNQTYLVDSSFVGTGVVAWIIFIRAVFTKKWTLVICALFASILVAANLFAYAFFDHVSWLMIVPVFILGYELFRNGAQSNEMSIMILLAGFCLVSFIEVAVSNLY